MGRGGSGAGHFAVEPDHPFVLHHKGMKMAIFSVYIGTASKLSEAVVYVGLTSQIPRRRFSWHKSRGKNLFFTVVSEHETHELATIEEERLIAKYLPTLNRRGINLPKSHLSQSEIDSRKSGQWCSVCLRRHVNKGYSVCLFCSRSRAKST